MNLRLRIEDSESMIGAIYACNELKYHSGDFSIWFSHGNKETVLIEFSDPHYFDACINDCLTHGFATVVDEDVFTIPNHPCSHRAEEDPEEDEED